MRHDLILLVLSATASASCATPASTTRATETTQPTAREAAHPTTFANPIDVDYRFMPELPSRREAADPTMVLFGDDYYLFASKSGGYWYSPDMHEWKLVVPEGYALEDYAPSVVVIGGRMYYTAHKSKGIYTTDDPKSGKWRKVADIDAYADPDLFLDDDGRLYLYYGSGLNGPINVVELDPKHDFKVIGGPFKAFDANYADHGWERSGPDNLGAKMAEGWRIGPYVEGSWMTKHNGTYYLQYSAPGTVWKSYADGVYTSKSPTSGFGYAPYSPFSYKPGGFVGSAGHAGTFRDKAGNYWRVVTMVISVTHKFERRLGIFPAGFDADGVMRTDTYLGDYPQYFSGVTRAPLDSNRTPWMLLSGGARATASSTLDGRPVANAFDEDIQTLWSARTGDSGEWLQADLGAVSEIRALQVNFGEQASTARSRATTESSRYVVESSIDGSHWSMLVDRSRSTRDAPHAYVELEAPASARYVRITNVQAAAGGTFSVRDLRVFGTSPNPLPGEVQSLDVRRHEDARGVTLTWNRAPNARGYVVRFGLSPEKLYSNYQVGSDTTLTMNSLNKGVTYYFTVDALNEGGVRRGKLIKGG
jgi:hypothetical protein